jgi:hypothetical protein
MDCVARSRSECCARFFVIRVGVSEANYNISRRNRELNQVERAGKFRGNR